MPSPDATVLMSAEEAASSRRSGPPPPLSRGLSRGSIRGSLGHMATPDLTDPVCGEVRNEDGLLPVGHRSNLVSGRVVDSCFDMILLVANAPKHPSRSLWANVRRTAGDVRASRDPRSPTRGPGRARPSGARSTAVPTAIRSEGFVGVARPDRGPRAAP